MTKFIGEYKARIDDKGRLVFPSAFKALMDSDEPMRLVVKKNLYSPCLDIYTYREWERESEDIKSRLNFFNPEHSTFWRGYMSGRAVVEPDGKLGRITIPRQLLESIGAGKEVIFAGNDHKIDGRGGICRPGRKNIRIISPPCQNSTIRRSCLRKAWRCSG